MINEVLRLNTERMGEPYIWLADTYDSIPDYNPEDPGTQGTLGPIDSNWRSPFVDSTVAEVAAFVHALTGMGLHTWWYQRLYPFKSSR